MDSAKQQGRGARSKVGDGDKVLHSMQDAITWRILLGK